MSPGLAFAQSTDPAIGFLPQMALSHSVSSDFLVTGKVESRYGLYKSEPNSGHDLTDLQGFLTYKVHPLWKLTAGYQYRLNEETFNSHRSIQQITYLAERSACRVIHRFRADQTYYQSEKAKLRGRYRISLELPFEGRSIDAGEYYMILSTEPIFSVQDNESEWEDRLVSLIGHLFRGDTRIEAGIDYRISNITGNDTGQVFWMTVGCYWNL
jgi:hypothetical protein